MPTLREFSQTPGITKNPDRLKFLYWNQIVKDSPKYKSLDVESKNKIFNELVKKPGLGVAKEMAKETYGAFKQLPGIRHGDIAVEKTAEFIEPKVPAGRTTLGLYTKDLPRQIVADVARSYKPSTLLPFLAATKVVAPVIGKVAKPVAKAIGKKIPAPVKKLFLKKFTVGKGQPQAFRKLTAATELERAAGAREAEAVAKTLTTTPKGKVLPLEQQAYIGRIFRKEVIESPALKAHPKFQQLKSISDEGRVVMDKWSTALAQSGIPKEQTKQVIEANVGQYMARMYKSKLQKTKTGFGFKDLRLRLNGLKQKKELSDAVLKQLGEIKEPALPTAIRVKEISTSIANNKLFKQVAKNPEWVANANTTGSLVKMADTPSLGALRNKWVVTEIAEEVNAITQAASQAQNWYAKGMGAWKYGKVVLNPATHARNMMSNSMLLDLSGTNHIRQARLYPKAFKEYLSKGKIYQQALKDGAVGGEFIGGDVAKIKASYMAAQGGNLQKWTNVLKTPFKKAGDVYQGEEQLAKLVKYMDVMERGGTSKLAAAEAQKWLFDYREIPDVIKAAKHIAPFITFCVSSDTQILTLRGWKYFSELKNNDKTLAYNIKNERLDWQNIKTIHIFPYIGEMYQIKHRSLDILMTPEHRNIVFHRTQRSKVSKIVLAKNLNSRDSIIVAGNYSAFHNPIVEDDMVRLVGWFVTEGWISPTSRGLFIGQTNEQGQKEIETLRKRLKINKYNIQKRSFKLGGYKIHKVYYFPSFIRDRILKLVPDKQLTVEFLVKLTNKQLQILYETILLADGCNSSFNPVIIQKTGITADTIQILGIMLGKQFGWSLRENNIVSITVTRKRCRELKRNKPEKVNYNGLVWCPKTQWGTWVARRNGKVFITGNTYKALPRIGEALINNPMKIYKYKAFFDGINEASRKFNGMTTEEYARQKKALPPWMLKDIGGIPTNLLMPWTDKHGRTQWLNLEYILPIGQAPEIAQKGLKGFVSNPIINLVSDLTKNVDFKGDAIIPVGATKAEATAIATNHTYRQLVPSLAPGLKGYKGWEGGYSFSKIMNALDKTPDFADRTRSVPITLLDTLVGIKINALDVDEAESFRLYDKRKTINDLKNQIRKLEHPAISEEYRDRRTEEIFQKIQRIIDDI